MNLGCAILAGGSGSRLGGINKALARVEGIPIISRIISVVTPLFSNITIVTDQQDAFDFPHVGFVSDRIAGVGPLGGIHAALQDTGCDALLILACDMPFLNGSFIEDLCDEYLMVPCDILVPRYSADQKRMNGAHPSQLIEPLHSIYGKGLEGRMESHLKSAEIYSIRDFVLSVDTRFYDLPDNPATRLMFTNLNTKEDFRFSHTSF